VNIDILLDIFFLHFCFKWN